MSDQSKATMLSKPQKATLVWRRRLRAFAVTIYPPLDQHTLNELDVEFQKGLEIGMEVEKRAQERLDARAGKRLVSREVMGQDDNGTSNGEDYTEQRWVTDWRRV